MKTETTVRQTPKKKRKKSLRSTIVPARSGKGENVKVPGEERSVVIPEDVANSEPREGREKKEKRKWQNTHIRSGKNKPPEK